MVAQIGLFGLLMLLIAWIIETIESIRTRQSRLPIYFIIISGLGSLFLAIENLISLGDTIYTILMSSITLLVIVQLLFLMQKGKKR